MKCAYSATVLGFGNTELSLGEFAQDREWQKCFHRLMESYAAELHRNSMSLGGQLCHSPSGTVQLGQEALPTEPVSTQARLWLVSWNWSMSHRLLTSVLFEIM